MELPIPASSVWAAIPEQFPSATAISHRAPSGASHTTSNTYQRPVRSRWRPFGVPSPCRKNEQDNCRFTWDWQPQRLPASFPRQQVSSRARRSHSTSSSERPHAYTHTLNPHQHLSLTLTRQISAARGPRFAASLLLITPNFLLARISRAPLRRLQSARTFAATPDLVRAPPPRTRTRNGRQLRHRASRYCRHQHPH